MAENILTSLGKIKTAIASDNGGNTQAPANLTDALSGIAGAITEQKGSGSESESDNNELSLYIFSIDIPKNNESSETDFVFKKMPSSASTYDESSEITWKELEDYILSGKNISLYSIQVAYGAAATMTKWPLINFQFSLSNGKIATLEGIMCLIYKYQNDPQSMIVEQIAIMKGNESQFKLYYNQTQANFAS